MSANIAKAALTELARRHRIMLKACHATLKWFNAWRDEGLFTPEDDAVFDGLKAAVATGEWGDNHSQSFAGPVVAPTEPTTECDHPWHDNPALIFPCPSCGVGPQVED
jgi:hypothetical protein